MADSRINLLTSAPSTASDDFFVVDGTTNGTRKLNAFSPTIGGNLAVTGTLTVGSTGTVSGNLLVNSSTAQVIIGQASASQLTYLIRPAQAGGAIQIVQDSATVNRWLALGGCDNNGVFGEGLRVGPNIQIPGTTASTSTSSGALVVSGGVGVAKNASIGVNNSTGVLRICDNSFGGDYVVLTTAGTDGTGTYGLFISQSSGSGLNATTGQMASLRVNNASIVSANSAGPILQLTGTAPTLTGNASLTFEFTSNTSLTLKMRGNDGVTRSASITFS